MSATPNPLLPREEPVRLLDPAGTILTDPEYALPEPERLLAGYRHLVTGRRVNDQCNALVRQGRLAVYPSSTGQEACQVAAVLSLAD
jgi:2-oxoisovalerate dehydrogenase E1 component alpha subunit